MTRRALLLTLLVLAATFTASASWRYSAMVETERIHNRTETKHMKHTIPADYDGTRFSARLKLTKGEATVRLRDNKNVERWAKTFHNGDDLRIEQEFPDVTGEWKVDLQFKGASGKYTVKLEDY